ncbi:MAG: DNA mismatch endonuclease Vsr [Gammaproteobacteria bacterium]|nr:DNA mismatch endonuclease Vsr [Gammaproteobacteria bacterium]
MIDTLTPSERSARMALVKASNTKPEIAIRKLVYALGYRYRLHDKKLPGTPDLVFSSKKKIIFVHGCFWHRHASCKLARLPKSRLGFWLPKLESNRKRDLVSKRALKRMGWQVMIIWECQAGRTTWLGRQLSEFLE